MKYAPLFSDLLTLKSHDSHACGGDPLVDARADTEESHTCGADGKGCLGAGIALERGQRTVGLRDVHGLHNQQIVVK